MIDPSKCSVDREELESMKYERLSVKKAIPAPAIQPADTFDLIADVARNAGWKILGARLARPLTRKQQSVFGILNLKKTGKWAPIARWSWSVGFLADFSGRVSQKWYIGIEAPDASEWFVHSMFLRQYNIRTAANFGRVFEKFEDKLKIVYEDVEHLRHMYVTDVPTLLIQAARKKVVSWRSLKPLDKILRESAKCHKGNALHLIMAFSKLFIDKFYCKLEMQPQRAVEFGKLVHFMAMALTDLPRRDLKVISNPQDVL